LLTPVEGHILLADYDGFFFLGGIGFNQRDLGYVFVDTWVMAEGLSESEIRKMKQLSIRLAYTGNNNEPPVCCWEYQDGAEFHVRSMISGYARTIIHHKTKGIFGFYEGHFIKGRQVDFGRSMNFFPGANWYYTESIYTGWFPDEWNGGIGISFVDKNTVYEGHWP